MKIKFVLFLVNAFIKDEINPPAVFGSHANSKQFFKIISMQTFRFCTYVYLPLPSATISEY